MSVVFKSERVKIKLRGESVPIDKAVLDILAVAQFGEKYECDEVKKKVRIILKEIVGPGDRPPHPQEVYRAVMASFLPAAKQKLLL
jgi:hypothetical protein